MEKPTLIVHLRFRDILKIKVSLIVWALAFLIGTIFMLCGCITARPYTITDAQYADCGKCVSEKEFNDCVDQNRQLRLYLTDCIKQSKQSVRAIEQCQDESRSRALRAFGWGNLTGGGIIGILAILLVVLL